MSNASIIHRLTILADDYEQGRATLGNIASEIVGQAEALEGMEYRKIKEVQLVQAQIVHAIESGREQEVDEQSILLWLRDWIAEVPLDL